MDSILAHCALQIPPQSSIIIFVGPLQVVVVSLIYIAHILLKADIWSLS